MLLLIEYIVFFSSNQVLVTHCFNSATSIVNYVYSNLICDAKGVFVDLSKLKTLLLEE